MGDSSQSRFTPPPLWARWVLTIVGFVCLSVAIVLAVHAVNNSGSSSSERSAALEADRESQILVEEDQAPHTARLHHTLTARTALERAIRGDVRNRVRHGQFSGPVQSVRCTSAGARRSARRAFRCDAHAGGIAYQFLGVVDERTQKITWCKVDPAPVSKGPMEVAVSSACQA